jgi:hypothetical protein
MKRIHLLLFFLVWSISVCAQKPVFPLHANENGRYLVDNNNKPFFYQAETPWLIFVNLNEKDMGELMDIRIRQGFTVIQTMALTNGKNVNGDQPFENSDFTKPNLAYFEHMRKGIQLAEKKGLLVGVALAWKGCCGGAWSDITFPVAKICSGFREATTIRDLILIITVKWHLGLRSRCPMFCKLIMLHPVIPVLM